MKSHKNNYSNDTKLALLEQSIGHINETLLRLEKRFDFIDKKFDLIDKRFETVDKKFEAVDKKFEAVDKKFEAMEKNFDAHFDKIEARFDKLDNRLWTFMFLIVSSGIGLFISKLFHWI